MDPAKPETGILGSYTVRFSDLPDRTFGRREDALSFFLERKGPVKMFGLDGELMLTRGTPPPDA